jgi:hypothetical protein
MSNSDDSSSNIPGQDPEPNDQAAVAAGESDPLIFANGTVIQGESFPLSSARIPDALADVADIMEVLPPERPEDAPRDPGDIYASESASGFEFPREHLDSDFDDRVFARDAQGVPMLALSDESDRAAPAPRVMPREDERRQRSRRLRRPLGQAWRGESKT